MMFHSSGTHMTEVLSIQKRFWFSRRRSRRSRSFFLIIAITFSVVRISRRTTCNGYRDR